MVKASPSNARGLSLIPGRGAKIPYALRPKNQNIKQKQYCNKFNKDFKSGPHQKKKESEDGLETLLGCSLAVWLEDKSFSLSEPVSFLLNKLSLNRTFGYLDIKQIF